jgi:four helix bundle protein
MKPSTYRDLEVWQIGMTLVERCYVATKAFPRSEEFGLTSQMRRAAISIPANVAEGACRKSSAVFRNHLTVALGSQAELETCTEIARRLGYLSEAARIELVDHCARVGRLLNGLHHSLRPVADDD